MRLECGCGYVVLWACVLWRKAFSLYDFPIWGWISHFSALRYPKNLSKKQTSRASRHIISYAYGEHRDPPLKVPNLRNKYTQWRMWTSADLTCIQLVQFRLLLPLLSFIIKLCIRWWVLPIKWIRKRGVRFCVRVTPGFFPQWIWKNELIFMSNDYLSLIASRTTRRCNYAI